MIGNTAMEEEKKYSWEANPSHYAEQSVNDAIMEAAPEPAPDSKSRKLAFLNEITELTQGPRTTIRYSVVVLDLSPYKFEFPLARKEIILKHLQTLVNNYFDENPLSQMAVVMTAGGLANIVCSFTSSSKEIVDIKVYKVAGGDCQEGRHECDSLDTKFAHSMRLD
eukprot:TRINITY_DN10530_c0_g1_i3.p2 TRINITY_DN10530_c0_g1~~TRINITY_DN10530_c0_g1_i3.p2  ORF type:complete len:166 (-),score=33.13 TRINITY_DN10530_c0_g1_i3:694-1191(-)